MRRALLTTARSGPVTIGSDAFGTNVLGVPTTINISDPATGSGTVTTVNMQVITAGTFYVVIGSLSGSTFTVRSVSAPTFYGTGLKTLTTSLAVLAGDYIGVVSSDGGRIGASVLSGEAVGFMNTASTPTPGSTIGPLSTSANDRLSIFGTA